MRTRAKFAAGLAGLVMGIVGCSAGKYETNTIKDFDRGRLPEATYEIKGFTSNNVEYQILPPRDVKINGNIYCNVPIIVPSGETKEIIDYGTKTTVIQPHEIYAVVPINTPFFNAHIAERGDARRDTTEIVGEKPQKIKVPAGFNIVTRTVGRANYKGPPIVTFGEIDPDTREEIKYIQSKTKKPVYGDDHDDDVAGFKVLDSLPVNFTLLQGAQKVPDNKAGKVFLKGRMFRPVKARHLFSTPECQKPEHVEMETGRYGN